MHDGVDQLRKRHQTCARAVFHQRPEASRTPAGVSQGGGVYWAFLRGQVQMTSNVPRPTRQTRKQALLSFSPRPAIAPHNVADCRATHLRAALERVFNQISRRRPFSQPPRAVVPGAPASPPQKRSRFGISPSVRRSERMMASSFPRPAKIGARATPVS